MRVEAREVCIAFLRAHTGKTYDAVTASRSMRIKWGINVDWHEFATVLDMMEYSGHAEIVKPGGFVQYKITFEETGRAY